MPKIVTAKEAAEHINDGATVAFGAMGLSGWLEEVVRAIENRFLETGSPQDLNVVQGSNSGDRGERGVTRLGHEGLMSSWIGAHVGFSPNVCKLITGNKIDAYCIPQGLMVNLWREIAAHRPGLITKVGLGTFIDPRVEGGKMNSSTKKEFYRLHEIDGEEYLFIKSFPVDVAVIRGTTIDEEGNLSLENEGIVMEQLQLAQAAHNSGGIVIAQAEYLVKAKSLKPKSVKVPGILVDFIVIATDKDACWQTETKYFEPSFSGAAKIPLSEIPSLPLSANKIIVRRAAMELTAGAIVNLGIGIATGVASVASEEGVSEMITLTTEAGSVGGVPAGGQDIGHSYNPDATIEHNAMFDFYDGGGLDIAFLGLAQADRHGNVNVSKFGERPMGPGGFINISQNSKKVVFTGTFTAGGIKSNIIDGKLHIETEGQAKKFLQDVEQITFSGSYSQKINQPVLYITERCVFTIENNKMTIIEVAPGVDIDKDIIAQMDFVPEISPNLKEMPSEIFQESWGTLKELIEKKQG